MVSSVLTIPLLYGIYESIHASIIVSRKKLHTIERIHREKLTYSVLQVWPYATYAFTE